MATITIRARSTYDANGQEVLGAVLYQGEHAGLVQAVEHCAQSGVFLGNASFIGARLSGANISGLQAPGADFTGADLTNVRADALVNGVRANIAAATLYQATFTGTLTEIDMSCTMPVAFRAVIGSGTRIRGCNFLACPDVLQLGITPSRGVWIAMRNGPQWKVHAGSDNLGNHVYNEDAAYGALMSDARYAAKLQWLGGPTGQAAKAAIDARAIGTGAVIRPG